MSWLWIILVLALVYIGIDYGRLMVKLRRIEAPEFMSYIPQRLMFFAAPDSRHMMELYELAVRSRMEAADNVRMTANNDGAIYTIFESGDELRFYTGEAKIKKLDQHEINDFVNHVFADYELPSSHYRAIIEELGLRNYMIHFGICDESQGEKGNG